MNSEQNASAVISIPDILACPHIPEALKCAGWTVQTATQDDQTAAASIALIVACGETGAPKGDGNQLIAALIDKAKVAAFPTDLLIDRNQSVAQIAKMLSLWLLPDTSSLTRMVEMFGQQDFLPVVRGLYGELDRALAIAEKGDRPDAHRLAGLTGTLGFAAASAAWQVVDQSGCEMQTALRNSKTTMVAIHRWLQGMES